MLVKWNVKTVGLALGIATALACGGSSSDSSDHDVTHIAMPFHYNNNTTSAIQVKNPYGTVIPVAAGGQGSDNITLTFSNNPTTGKPDDSAIDFQIPFKIYNGNGVLLKSTTWTPTYGQVKAATNVDGNWDGTDMTFAPE